MIEYLVQGFVYLTAAVIAVPLSKRFGLGSVLGYLLAGVIIGPLWGLVGEETNTIQHFAEFGVVLMLFLVGLELDPKALWRMRSYLLGLGGLQVSLTALLIAAGAWMLGLGVKVSIVVGLIFALSSTAIALQSLQEKKLHKTEGGSSAFAVLLFQDIAVIPILALIPLFKSAALETLSGARDAAHLSYSLVEELPAWLEGGAILAAIAVVIIAGHYLSRPLFKYVAASGLREVFTASALMLVIGISVLMTLVGLSPALGTFLAGVILANSEFRHELESNILPFKGLLLGLFFITVGAGINFSLLASNAFSIIGLTLGLMALKAIVLYAIGAGFKIKASNRWLFSLSLAQAGEFGFVLVAFAVQNFVIDKAMAEYLSLVIALSMFLTPFLFIAFERVVMPFYSKKTQTRAYDEIDDTGPVIVAGVGRFGQIVSRLLRSNNIKIVVLDQEFTQVELVTKIGLKSYFGDATRADLLDTAGLRSASAIVIAIDQQDSAVELVRYVRHAQPAIKIFARAFDRVHYYALKQAGADWIVSETYHSALEAGVAVLQSQGIHPFQAELKKQSFTKREEEHEAAMYTVWQKSQEDKNYVKQYVSLFSAMEEALQEAMRSDRSDKHARSERGWTPPPKNYLQQIEESEEA